MTCPGLISRVAVAIATVTLLSGAAASPASAIRGTVSTITGSELVVLAGGANLNKGIGWGRVVPYAGGVVLAGSLIYAGLNWFYEEAKRSTGTPLDDWWRTEEYSGWPVPGPFLPFNPSNLSTPDNVLEIYEFSQNTPGLPSHCGIGTMAIYRTGGGFYRVRFRNYESDAYSQLGAATQELLDRYLDHTQQCPVGARESLVDHLQNEPDSNAAVRNSILPGFVDVRMQEGFPYTYSSPLGPDAGVTLNPVPGVNQWYDNPAKNPQEDTDGDGWTDWEEWTAGTDPVDPGSYPSVSPDPTRDSDGDGWPDHEEIRRGTDPNDPNSHPDGAPPDTDPLPDTDGDGIPDAYDPCPFDAVNRCADGGKSEDAGEWPDDYATEGTLSSVLTEATGIRAEAERTANAVEELRDDLRQEIPGELELGDPEPFAEPDFSGLEAWVPDTSAAEVAIQTALQDVEQEFATVLTAAEGKFPFGVVALLGDVPAFSGSSECVSSTISIAGNSGNVNFCGTAIDSLLVSTVRPVLVAVMTVIFLWSLVGLVVRSA